MTVIRSAIYWFANILNFLILLRCIMSWFPIGKNNPIIRILFMLTDPILNPIRKLVDRSPLGGAGMMLDFSPFIACVLIMAVSNLLISLF